MEKQGSTQDGCRRNRQDIIDKRRATAFSLICKFLRDAFLLGRRDKREQPRFQVLDEPGLIPALLLKSLETEGVDKTFFGSLDRLNCINALRAKHFSSFCTIFASKAASNGVPALHPESGARYVARPRLIQDLALPASCTLARFKIRSSLNRAPPLHSG